LIVAYCVEILDAIESQEVYPLLADVHHSGLRFVELQTFGFQPPLGSFPNLATPGDPICSPFVPIHVW